MGICLLALVLDIVLISASFAQAPCGSGFNLRADRWTQIGPPCQLAPPGTVESALSDNLDVSEYAYRWVLYGWDRDSDSYFSLDRQSPLFPGEAYWILSKDAAQIDIAGSATPVTNALRCPSSDGCFVLDLEEPLAAGENRWTLLGHPYPHPVSWEDVCFVENGTKPYTPTEAENANLASKILHKYNGNGYDAYDDVTPGAIGVLESFNGFWAETLPGAFGLDLSLLIPAGVVDRSCSNTPPTLDAITDQQLIVGDSLNLTANATDPDPGDSVTYSLDVFPAGMTINAVGVINWTATPAGTHPVTVRAEDTAGAFDTKDFSVEVTENQPPDLVPPGNRNLQSGAQFKTPLFAIDPDPGDTLTFSLASAPSGMNVHPQSGMLSWTPGSVGSSNVIAKVTDTRGLFDTEQFTVEVVQPIVLAPRNEPPVLTLPADRMLIVGDTLNTVATATDPENGPITFEMFGPVGMSIDGAGNIAWTPAADQTGDHDVTIKVTDNGGLVDAGHFLVTVDAVNGPPVAVDDLYSVNFRQTLSVPAPGVLDNDSDPDSDPLTAALISPPARGDLTFNNDGSFVYKPTGLGLDISTNINLTLELAPVLNISSTYSASHPAGQAVDDDLGSSWYTERPDPLSSATPPWGGAFFEQIFDIPVTAKEIRLWNASDFGGYDFLKGHFSLFDSNDILLYDSGELDLLDLPDPNPDLAFVLPAPVADVVRIRFTSSAIENSNGEAGLAEFHVLGDGFSKLLGPVLEWNWDSSVTLPDEINISATPTVCDLDMDGNAEIIVPTYDSNDSQGSIRAFRGVDGTEVFVFDAIDVEANSQVACGDIDGDGFPELLATHGDAYVIALEHDGSLKWESADYGGNGGTESISLANLDGVGPPEIVIPHNQGITVLDPDGLILWSAEGSDGSVRYLRGGQAVVSDIDLDGIQEIVAGNTVYRNGSVEWVESGLPDGPNAIGNFDQDPYAEIVLMGSGEVYLLEHTGDVIWGPMAIPGSYATPPAVGDFDGDGQPEIGVAGSNAYVVLDTDGTLLWSQSISRGSSYPGTALFDFQGDGRVEVVFKDEASLFIFDGLTGAVLFETPLGSRGGVANPVVADVDNDGNAEIVVGSNDEIAGNLPNQGLWVFGDENWRAARPIWNQHGYHITNINADGGIPMQEQPNWLINGLNNFRQNDYLPEERPGSLDSFTYKANDGTLDSNPATVRIDLLPINTAPEFVSTPLEKATANFEYLYHAQATDQEDDPLTFALVNGPAGMSFDSATGLVRWSPTLTELGEHEVILSVTDAKGFSTSQAYAVLVAIPLMVPDVLDDTLPAASLEITLAMLAVGEISEQFHPAVPEGRVISQFPPAGALAQMGGPVDMVFSLGRSDDSDDDNMAPVAVDDNYEATLDVELSIPAPGVITNDSDADGDTMLAMLVDPASLGTATLQPDGSFTYLHTSTVEPPLNPVLEHHCDIPWSSGAQRIYSNEQMAVGDVDDDGDLEIVGTTYINLSFQKEFWIIDATTCATEFYPQEPQSSDSGILSVGGTAGKPALFDLDGDGDLEIITVALNPAVTGSGVAAVYNLVAFHHDGTLVWGRDGRTEDLPAGISLGSTFWGKKAPLLADLDANGQAEIIMPFLTGENNTSGVSSTRRSGAVAYNAADGTVKWQYISDSDDVVKHNNNHEPVYVADLDLDGTLEVLYHKHVIDHNGQLEFNWEVDTTSSALNPLYIGVANFDDDAFPEVIVRHNSLTGDYYLFEHDGTRTWKREYSSSAYNEFSVHPVYIGDFDGDDEMEFAFTHQPRFGTRFLVAYETDGSVLWSRQNSPDYPLYDEGNAGGWHQAFAKVFDVNRDGADDLVANYRDLSTVGRATLHAFDGRDGSILFSEESHFEYHTQGNFPVIADLDGDSQAEILTSGSGDGLSTGLGLRIFQGTASNPLPPAPPLYNQWVFNAAMQNLDASVPPVPTPHWLIPGFNGFHKIPSVRDVQAPQSVDDSFTYKVNDGALDSNIATVNLTVSPPMSPPVFTSTPKTFATTDNFYQYVAFAVDPDIGDTLTYRLVTAPAGMTIQPATGIIQWLPGSADLGPHPIRVMVEDDTGLADFQDFTLTVQVPAIVPDVIGLPQATAKTDIGNASLRVGNLLDTFSAIVPAGDVVDQLPLGGTEVPNGSDVNLFLSIGPGPLDSDDDSDGQTENEGDCNDDDDTVYAGAPDPLGDEIDQNCDGVDGDFGTAQIIIDPETPLLLAGQALTLKATAVFPDQTSMDITNIGIWSSTNGAIVQAGAQGFIVAVGAGNADMRLDHAGQFGSTTVTVVAHNVGDLTPPTAEITAPEPNATITAPVDIIGTASDANFLKYTLEIAPVGETTFTQIALGTTQVTDDVLGQFDPTLLLNDLYTLRLTVYDTGGNIMIAETVYQVDENMKVGNFSLTFADLQIPMSGIPITVNRTYDSRDKRMGDFGMGWRLDVQTLTLRTNRVPGTGWQVVKSGYNFILQPQDDHKVSITLPSGRVEEFDMVVKPSSSVFVPFPPFANRASFQARPGTLGTLESLDNNNLSVFGSQPGEIFLVDDITNKDYNPQRFKYTSADGTEIIVNKDNGVEEIIEPNGNTLEFRPDGIFHSAGKQALFERDGMGRIIKLTDPNGNEQFYAYDENGDLEAHTDPDTFETKYAYNRDHGLLTIIDPLDRPIARNEYDAAGRLVSTTSPDGRVITFTHNLGARQDVLTDIDGGVTVIEYDTRGNVLSSTDPLGNVTTNLYDSDGNQVSSTNAEGETTTRTFDARHNMLSETDPFGHITTYTFDGNDRITSVTDPLGRTSLVGYDTNGNVLTRTNADGIVAQQNSYGASGDMLTRTDALGHTTQYAYDVFGNMTERTDSLGYKELFNYDANGNQLANTNRRGFITTKTYNSRNLLKTRTDPLGATMTYGYTPTGVVQDITDALGNTTSRDIDAEGKELSSIDPLGNQIEKTYNFKSNLTGIVNERGYEVTFTYDVLGRQSNAVRPDGSATTAKYDKVGRVVERIDELGNSTQIEFDANGRHTKIIDPLSNEMHFELDSVGNRIGATDSNGNKLTFTYDNLDRLVRTTFPDGTFRSTVYDNNNNIISATDEAGNTNSYTYDAVRNLTQVTDPLGNSTEYIYDEENNLLKQTDANGNSTTFLYDQNNRRYRKFYPDGTLEITSYDAVGNITSLTDADGNTITYGYDANNRLISKTFPVGSLEVFSYTGTGKLKTVTDISGTITYTYDINDRLVKLENPDGSSITYAYDAAGNRASVTTQTSLTALPRTTTYTYDALNRIETVVDPDNNTTAYNYNNIGDPVAITYPNDVTTTLAYDSRNRLSLMTHDRLGVELGRFQYQVDSVGNRILATHTDGSRIEYTYDALNRLTSESHFNPVGTKLFELSYSYDAVGNRTSKTDINGAVTSYSYDAADKLLSSGSIDYTYDANGRMQTRTDSTGTSTYQYDYEDMLTSVTTPNGSVSYNYDAQGNRIQRADTNGETHHLVDPIHPTGVSQVLAEHDSASVQTAEYVWGNYLVSQNRDGTQSFFHHDANQNTRLLTDIAGNVTDTYHYEAFGAATTATGSTNNNHLFAGEQFDPLSNLSYNRARYYEPTIGRFISRDPFAGRITNPVSLHRYLYANANPVLYRDPTGELSSEFLVVVAVIATVTIVTHLRSVKRKVFETLMIGSNGFSQIIKKLGDDDRARYEAALIITSFHDWYRESYNDLQQLNHGGQIGGTLFGRDQACGGHVKLLSDYIAKNIDDEFRKFRFVVRKEGALNHTYMIAEYPAADVQINLDSWMHGEFATRMPVYEGWFTTVDNSFVQTVENRSKLNCHL